MENYLTLSDPQPYTLLWYSFWHIIWKYIYKTYIIIIIILIFYLASILTYFRASILTFFLAFILRFCLALSLAFSLAWVRAQAFSTGAEMRTWGRGRREGGKENLYRINIDPHLTGGKRNTWHARWWFQALWKIWVRQLGWWFFPIDGKSSNSCSKPPTSHH